jgi:hypothetical protein
LIKPSLYVYDNKGKKITNYKIGLNQIRSYLQKFQTKIKKEKGKRIDKRGKGSGTEFRPRLKTAHAHLSLSPKAVRSLFFSLTRGTRLSAPTSPSTSVRFSRPEIAQLPRVNPCDFVPISSPPRAYKDPSLLHPSPSQNPSRTDARLPTFELTDPQVPMNTGEVSGKLRPSPSLFFVLELFPRSRAPL